MAALQFIHISDTHIGTTADYLLYGHSTAAAAQKLVDYLNNDLPFEPDFVLHTGDVTYDPDPEAYKLAWQTLQQIRYPLYVVRGNHDEPDTMRRVLPNLPSGSGRIDYTFEVKGFRFIVLDSFGREQPRGYLEDTQLAWLSQQLALAEDKPVVISLHHLPTTTGNPWLDNFMLIENHDTLFATLAPHQSRIRGLFFGHIHSPSTTLRQGIMCSSAPAAFSQFSFPNVYPSTELTATAPGGFSLVTIAPEQTWISHHELGV